MSNALPASVLDHEPVRRVRRAARRWVSPAATLAAAAGLSALVVGAGPWPLRAGAGAATAAAGLVAVAGRRPLAPRRSSADAGAELQRLRLLESAVVHARDAVIVLEARGTADRGRAVLYVNAAFCRMSGYAAGEVVGRSLHFLRGPGSDPATLGRMRDALAGGTGFQGELLNYRKDGTPYWVELSLVPAVDAAGGCAHWVMIQRDVSDRRRAEEELRDREQRLRALGDNLPAGAVQQVVVGPDGDTRVTYVSAGVERLFGVTPAAVRADAGVLHRLVHPADRRRVRAADRAAARDLTPFDCEFRQYTAGGVVKWVHARSMPVRRADGAVQWDGLVLDITDRKRAEAALRESEGRFRGIFENAAAGVTLSDPDGRYVAVNPAFAALLGCRGEDLIGRPIRDVTHPADWGEQEPLDDALRAGGRDRYQIRKRYRRAGGGDVWAEVSVAAVRGPDGGYRYGLAVAVDLTERQHLEDQLRQAQKVESVGQLAGGIAHDFNNLLTGVIGNLALVAVPPGDPNAAYLDAAARAAARAADLTRKLLGYARKNQLLPAPVRAGELVAEVVDILRHTLDPRVVIAADAGSPACVVADATLLNQAVMNLCLNARDAMPAGGTLTVRVDAVDVGPAAAARSPDARPGAFVRLTVADTGCGMTPEVQARVFEPFFTTKPVGQGTGLGLAMAHGIVRQHHGWVTCESAPGAGTRFELYLPAAPAAAPAPTPLPPLLRHDLGPGGSDVLAPPPAADRAAASPAPAPAGRTVLLVDDEPMIRLLGKAVLEGAGYEVIEAGDGAEAVDVFRRDHPRIDLVVLDLMMPRLSGRDAFRRMVETAPAARVLFCSGYSADDLSDVTGSCGLLPKPYRPQELLSAVRRALTEPVAAPAC